MGDLYDCRLDYCRCAMIVRRDRKRAHRADKLYLRVSSGKI